MFIIVNKMFSRSFIKKLSILINAHKKSQNLVQLNNTFENLVSYEIHTTGIKTKYKLKFKNNL